MHLVCVCNFEFWMQDSVAPVLNTGLHTKDTPRVKFLGLQPWASLSIHVECNVFLRWFCFGGLTWSISSAKLIDVQLLNTLYSGCYTCCISLYRLYVSIGMFDVYAFTSIYVSNHSYGTGVCDRCGWYIIYNDSLVRFDAWCELSMSNNKLVQSLSTDS